MPLSAECGHVLLVHKLGVVDVDYVSNTGCAASLVGRKVTITDGDVHTLVTHLKTLAEALYHGVPRI
ncbi:MAG: hypothetical protein WBC18_18040 [Ottowia sp.]|uniref:hypothetical protein n=1 Tax=Ottowia sp. TaxID=1898956 RepID=UPI003C76654D